MSEITNYHVPDATNIGDLLSSPLHYFEFPGFSCRVKDIREVVANNVDGSHIIVGGGGLLSERFLPHIQEICASKAKKLILWGVGQQGYGKQACDPEGFDYEPFLRNSDLVGIRDDRLKYSWVPCVSCMHSAFDKPRTPKHEFVVFSHKKFKIDFPKIPTMSNLTTDFESVLDFLGSGETVLTSSFHGAYWGTLLGRKVLAFPFSSKFFTLRHQPALYPVKDWTRVRWQLSVFGRSLFTRLHDGDKLTCKIPDWKSQLAYTQTYPESLSVCRERNRWFYQQVLQILEPQ